MGKNSMIENYDSWQDTMDHILRVRELLYIVQGKLEKRGFGHDQSKLQEPEKSAFDKATPKLKGLTYGSPEYKASIAELGPALAHHYAHNSHHPEYYQKQVCIICFAEYQEDHKENCKQCGNGTFTKEPCISGMTLFDIVEMLCDWKAATERHADGDILRSLELNAKRFKINPQLASILRNTIEEMRW